MTKFVNLIIGSLLLISATAQATDYSEGYESFALFSDPQSGEFYTVSGSGTPTVSIRSDVVHSGTKALNYTTSGFPNSRYYNLGQGIDVCNADQASFWVRFDTFSAAANNLNALGFLTAGDPDVSDTPGFWVQVSDTGAVSAAVASDTPFSVVSLSLGTLALDTWYDFTFSNIDCAGASVLISSNTLGNGATPNAAGTIAGSIDTFVNSGTFLSSALANRLWLDELNITGLPDEIFWCSAPGSTNFDYDFLEDVERDETEIGIEIDPFYKFTGTSSDYGYLGKSFGGTNSAPTTGSTHLRSYFRIEAANDASDTNFRSSMVFLRSNGTESSPTMDKGTGSTAGDTTGQFADHIEAEFKEFGNDWVVKFFVVNATAGYATRTQVGPSFVGDDPNSPTSYVFDLDTIARTMEVRHFNGEVLLSQALPSPWNDKEIYGHFFVGFHTNVLGSPQTALDEDKDTDLSTCLEDVTGLSSFNGGPGSIPTDLVEPEAPAEATTPSIVGIEVVLPGFTAAATNWLLGILLLVAMMGGLYFAFGRSAVAGGFGGVAAFGANFAFGFWPLWFLVALVVIAAAVVFLRAKDGASA